MSQPKESLAERILRWLAEALHNRPRAFFYAQMVLFVAALFYTVTELKLDFSRNNLVGGNQRYHQNYLNYKKEFNVRDDMVVVVESENLEKNRQFVERIGARLDAETNLFSDVFYKGDLKLMGDKALMFVPEDKLGEMKKALVDFRPFIQHFTGATNLDAFISLVNRQILSLRNETNAESANVKGLMKALPALERIVEQATDSLRRPGTPVSPGMNALFNGGAEAEREMYITFANGRLYLVSARAASDQVQEDAVKRLRELVALVKAEVPGVNAGMTGEPVLEFDEKTQSEFDSTVASIVSLVLCMLIFIYGYQETGRPLKATACLVVGLVYTLGFTALTIGHLNILTITFVPMLVGMAIDFGVHLITRFEEELRHGRTAQAALQKAIVYTGQGIFTGAFTTAGAFLAMGATDFRGVQEMGLICGGGMLICLIPMMTLLPVLLMRGRQNKLDREGKPAKAETPQKRELALSEDKREALERRWLDHPWWVIGITAALCLLAATQMRKVGFDYNLLHMQSAGLPAVELEEKLIKSAGRSVIYGVVVADDLKHGMELEAKLKTLPTVAGVESLNQFLVPPPASKLAAIGEIKQAVSDIHFAPVDTAPANPPELSATLWRLKGYMGAAAESAGKEDPELAAQMTRLGDKITELRKELNSDKRSEAETAAKIGAYQRAFFKDIQETFASIQNQDNRSGLQPEDVPTALRHRFVGQSGKLLLQVYPKQDVWDREPQEQFVKEMRSLVPDVTGTPVQLYEYTSLLKLSYEEAARYSLIVIVVLVLIHFRSFACVILSLLPVGIGWLWMVGAMGWHGEAFNPANIMTLPLIVGIGVTNGIHILNRYAEEAHPSILARSTGKAVIVSGLTTIIGFGSLIIGKHQGIKSLGYVMAFGVAACMIAGVTFLPALLTLLHKKGWRIKKPSTDNAQPMPGREEPR